MSTQKVSQVEPEIIPSLPPSELSAHDTAIRKASVSLKISRCQIAYHGWRLRKSNSWNALGFANEEAYRESAGIGPQTWDTCLLVGRLLEPLSLEQLIEIGVDKGKLLSQVSSDLWFDYPWLDDARAMSISELRDAVTMRNRTLDSGEASIALAEAEAANTITRGQIKYLQRKHGLNKDDAVAMALRDSDSTVAIELAKAIKHAAKLLTLASQSVTLKHSAHKIPRPYQIREGNAKRLIEKARVRMLDALAACVTGLQSK
jgi:hypothetical protein